jgi:hypothetical protein
MGLVLPTISKIPPLSAASNLEVWIIETVESNPSDRPRRYQRGWLATRANHRILEARGSDRLTMFRHCLEPPDNHHYPIPSEAKVTALDP